MTKVVFQGRDYWLQEEFWQEARDLGVKSILVEIKDGILRTRSIHRDEFATLFPGRVANWVKSESKSISVFREALGTAEQILVNRFYLESILAGLNAVAREFTARVGAQGKVRLPAEASFVVVIHNLAKDGSPQLHAHIAVGDRVKVQGQDNTYATHKRELYQLRKLFAATSSQHFANQLHKDLGVRVQKTEHGVELIDVPKSLCKQSSVRTKQIDDYIKKHQLKNTPLTRKYAAIVTRRQNRNRQIGRDAFQAELQRTGFQSAQILNRVTLDQHVDQKRQSVVTEMGRIEKELKHLARNQPTVTRNELFTKALETASPEHPVWRVTLVSDSLLSCSKHIGLIKRKNEYGNFVYASRNSTTLWKRITKKIEFVLKSKIVKAEQVQANEGKCNQRKAKDTSQSQKPSDRQTNSARDSERSGDFRRVVEKALRSYQIIGAVGHAGMKAVEVAVELYQNWSKPVWRVHGNGHKTTPGSVAKMVRDLKPLTVMESHKAAILAMLKLNGSLDQKLRYGEFVYRQSRKAKFRVPRKSLIVIRDVGLANPKDVNFLMRKAERAKAKIMLVDRDVPRSLLVQAAKSMKPGETKRYNGPEMSR